MQHSEIYRIWEGEKREKRGMYDENHDYTVLVCVRVSNVNTTQPVDNSYLLLKLSARGGAGHKKGKL